MTYISYNVTISGVTIYFVCYFIAEVYNSRSLHGLLNFITWCVHSLFLITNYYYHASLSVIAGLGRSFLRTGTRFAIYSMITDVSHYGHLQ